MLNTFIGYFVEYKYKWFSSFAFPEAKLGILQSLRCLESLEFPFTLLPQSSVFSSLLLLRKPLFDSRKKTEDTVIFFSRCSVQSFLASFLASFSCILYLASSCIFILFSSSWFQGCLLLSSSRLCLWPKFYTPWTSPCSSPSPCFFQILHHLLPCASGDWFRLKSNPATGIKGSF